MSDKMTGARAEIASAEAALRRARERLIELEREACPPEPMAGYVSFEIRLGINAQLYRYAAVRVNGRWYTTGEQKRASNVSWEELIDWIRRNHYGMGSVYVRPLASTPGEEITVEVNR